MNVYVLLTEKTSDLLIESWVYTMQKIVMKENYEQGWIRMFTHLANLFFEQSKIVDEDEEGAILANLTLERTLDGQLVGKAILTWDGVDYSAEFSETEETDDDKAITRQLKRIYSHVFLETLEQATGMHQSWGIYRDSPDELYHKYRREGYSTEEAQQLLMNRHRLSSEKSELLAKIANVQLANSA